MYMYMYIYIYIYKFNSILFYTDTYTSALGFNRIYACGVSSLAT